MIYDLQKASMLKRISAFLFDFILMTVVVAGLMFLLSLVFGYDNYSDTFNAKFEEYQTRYDVEFNITQEALSQKPQDYQDRFQAATDALNKDQDALYAYSMMTNLALIILSVSILAGFLIMEFLIPLKLGNGQTLGKKIFSLAVMRNDGVKLNTITLFVRTVLGKCTVETMVPVLVLMLILFAGLGMVGTVILVGLLILQIALLIATHTNAAIHDKFANTVVVDMSSQMIFDSELELIAYKQRKQEEKAAKSKYF